DREWQLKMLQTLESLDKRLGALEERLKERPQRGEPQRDAPQRDVPPRDLPRPNRGMDRGMGPGPGFFRPS
ncbi:MAG TPA: hypothetical protein VM389_08235, partial [Phycisphaerae bacterium]|nr:hypothetical protein [Phycisphaerae bacterium]